MGYEAFEFAKTTINIMQTIIVVDNFRLALAELCSSTTHFDRKPSSCVVKVGRLLRETMPEPTCVKIQHNCLVLVQKGRPSLLLPTRWPFRTRHFGPKNYIPNFKSISLQQFITTLKR